MKKKLEGNSYLYITKNNEYMSNKKTIIITGANRGLGLALTEKLAAEGNTIIMVCRDSENARKVFKSLQSAGLSVVIKYADIAIPQQIDTIFESIYNEFKSVDVLINNAAINIDGEKTSLETLSLETIEKTFNTNIIGSMWMSKKALPLLKNAAEGRIINFSSGLGHLTVPRMGPFPAYSISKTAVNSLTHYLAEELKDTNISVVSVDPGWVRTDLGGPNAPLAIEEGIDTPYWLATVEKDKLENGKFYKEKSVITW
ncbi:MAG: SDR family NAD(P)-dependent oxidoreductase [Bacteroidales bacterium]|nr:SDR family NAD(P)-dependent oxidoreductase [Bacteroidales bacterium]